jgi:hypothetical protein
VALAIATGSFEHPNTRPVANAKAMNRELITALFGNAPRG